jgi:inorganic pyrophosphatase
MLSTDYINTIVTIKIDRRLGSRHPERGFIFPVNYGFVPYSQLPDRDVLDAYVLGIFEPLAQYTGRCIAVIHRMGNEGDKLVVAPQGKTYTDEQIRALTEFQERYFQSVIRH